MLHCFHVTLKSCFIFFSPLPLSLTQLHCIAVTNLHYLIFPLSIFQPGVLWLHGLSLLPSATSAFKPETKQGKVETNMTRRQTTRQLGGLKLQKMQRNNLEMMDS